MPKVSVIIPVYGVEKYIERCARGLFEQTLDDIEFIFVNDCTPDNSIIILETTLAKYPKRIPQTQIINFNKNKGAAKARETGIKMATGEYIIHCDSDDWVDCTIYEKLYNKAIETNSDIVICDMYESNGYIHTLYPQRVKSQKKSYLADLISRTTTCSLCNKLVRRKIAQNTSIISPISHMLEDQLLCVQYVYLASTLSYLPEPLYFYFVNTQSICHHISEDSCRKRALDSISNINSLLSFLKSHHILTEYKKDFVDISQEELMAKNDFDILAINVRYNFKHDDALIMYNNIEEEYVPVLNSAMIERTKRFNYYQPTNNPTTPLSLYDKNFNKINKITSDNVCVVLDYNNGFYTKLFIGINEITKHFAQSIIDRKIIPNYNKKLLRSQCLKDIFVFLPIECYESKTDTKQITENSNKLKKIVFESFTTNIKETINNIIIHKQLPQVLPNEHDREIFKVYLTYLYTLEKIDINTVIEIVQNYLYENINVINI